MFDAHLENRYDDVAVKIIVQVAAFNSVVERGYRK